MSLSVLVITWFHRKCLPFSQRPAPWWLRGFPVANGKLAHVCERCGHNTHVTVTLSLTHSWGYTSRSCFNKKNPWCHSRPNEKTKIKESKNRLCCGKSGNSVLQQASQKERFWIKVEMMTQVVLRMKPGCSTCWFQVQKCFLSVFYRVTIGNQQKHTKSWNQIHILVKLLHLCSVMMH